MVARFMGGRLGQETGHSSEKQQTGDRVSAHPITG
jgi:hypothetical protein